MEQMDIEAAIERLREKTSKLTGNKRRPRPTEKIEFFKPIYDKPIVIRSNINETYAAAGIPKRYYGMSFEWLKENGTFQNANKEAYAIVKDYRDNLAEYMNTGKGLILRGPAGTGKTSLAVCILKEVMKLNTVAMMISMPNLLDTMLTLSKGDRVAYLAYEQKLKHIPMLLLDDFGAEYSKSDWVAAKVESIIIERYNSMRPIIITTNYSDQWTKDNYSGRIYDRLRGEYKIAVFMGQSHRLEN